MDGGCGGWLIVDGLKDAREEWVGRVGRVLVARIGLLLVMLTTVLAVTTTTNSIRAILSVAVPVVRPLLLLHVELMLLVVVVQANLSVLQMRVIQLGCKVVFRWAPMLVRLVMTTKMRALMVSVMML